MIKFVIFALSGLVMLFLMVSFIEATFNPKEMDILSKCVACVVWIFSLGVYIDINSKKR